MPPFHLDMSYIKKGTHEAGASGFQRYLAREDRDAPGDARLFHRYLDPAHGREDLRATGSGDLPSWAQSPAQFFQAADTYERPGWVVARHLQVTIPRELSPQGRLDLAQDIVRSTVSGFPHFYAVHEPPATDRSGLHPHVHILFSPRANDGLARTPERWFAKAAARGRDPAEGGARKDRGWDSKGRLYAIREGTALLINSALHRDGQQLAVDHRTLEAQGLSRDSARFGGASDKADREFTLKYRVHLRDSGVTAYEERQRYQGWLERARELPSLARGYVLERARELVHGLGRDVGRSFDRARELGRGPAWARQQERERALKQARERGWQQAQALEMAGREQSPPDGWGLER